MKKFLSYFVAIIAVAVVVTSCGGGSASTPSQAAEKMIKYIQKGDFKSFSQGLNLEGDKEREEFTTMMEEKAAKAPDGQLISSYKILGEEISEDGTSAKVMTNMVYSDGSDKTSTMKFSLDENNEWKMELK
ncbi:MAG: DUF4878 domain-containing protein [Rikenellaceae bacterium]